MRGLSATLLVTLVLLIDQVSKFWVKTNMYIGQEFDVLGDWFKIHFIENDGMAFGLSFGGVYGKIALTSFRIICVIGIFFIIRQLLKKNGSLGFILALSLIFAGAMGNIIDSLFYGKFFEASSGSLRNVANFLPSGGGYAGFLQGQVVDMLYFPLVDGFWPEWVPVIGGRYFSFFRPVFNVADAAITTGVATILIFYRSFFTES